jgi:archaellum biogenesis ATPase FlaH
MFLDLPPEIELLIYRFHFEREVIPEFIKRVDLKRNFKNKVLHELMEKSIFIKSQQIIYSTFKHILTTENIPAFDNMIRNIVEIHNYGHYDIFDYN